MAKKGTWQATVSKSRLGPALPMTRSEAWIYWKSLGVKGKGIMLTGGYFLKRRLALAMFLTVS